MSNNSEKSSAAKIGEALGAGIAKIIMFPLVLLGKILTKFNNKMDEADRQRRDVSDEEKEKRMKELQERWYFHQEGEIPQEAIDAIYNGETATTAYHIGLNTIGKKFSMTNAFKEGLREGGENGRKRDQG